MVLKGYGVWKAHLVSFTIETKQDDPKSPHAHLRLEDGVTRTKIEAAVNVKSIGAVSELVYWHVPRLDKKPALLQGSDLTDALEALNAGFTPLKNNDKSGALDYIHGGLFDLEDGRVLPHDIPGPNNDVIDVLTDVLSRARDAPRNQIYVFGQQFNSKDGIHDVHMNQGNSERQFRSQNGPFQDGGIIIHFPADSSAAGEGDEGREDRGSGGGHWEGVFLAFASQISETDEHGQPIGSVTLGKLIASQATGGSGAGNDEDEG